MAEIIIGMPYRVPSISPDRWGQTDMVIPYRIDSQGPYEVRMPEDDYTPEKGSIAVTDAARQQVALYGRKLII